jgi:hypothetical protein
VASNALRNLFRSAAPVSVVRIGQNFCSPSLRWRRPFDARRLDSGVRTVEGYGPNLVTEATPVLAQVRLDPHERAPSTLVLGQLGRAKDNPRNSAEAKRSRNPLQRLAALRVLGEVRNADQHASGRFGERDQRRSAAPYLGVLV